jgi:hypothetical protein
MSTYEEYDAQIRRVWDAEDALNKLMAELVRPHRGPFQTTRTRREFDRWIGELKKRAGVTHANLQDANLEARASHVDKALAEVMALDPNMAQVTLNVFETGLDFDKKRKQWFHAVSELAVAGGEVLAAQIQSLTKHRFALRAKQNAAMDAEKKARHAEQTAEEEATKAAEAAPVSDFLIPIRLEFTLLDGHQFEDLVYAHVDNQKDFKTLEHYGASGSDGGRDIWATTKGGATTCFLIANRPTMGLAKIVSDLESLKDGEKGLPSEVTVVTSKRNVSATIRDDAKEHGRKIGLETDVVVWSGNEFEMKLRNHSGKLVARTFGHRREP